MIELLQKYPKAAKLVKEYYLEQLMKGLKENLPEEFKEHVREMGIDDEKIAKLIEVNPHHLFYFFDESKIVINTPYKRDLGFTYVINTIPEDPKIYVEGNGGTNMYKTRLEAELESVKEGFNVLESKLL